MVRCPVCGSRDVTKLPTGSYKCNSCGITFYPERDAIIDMRDLIDSKELTPEEKDAITEKIGNASHPIGKKIFGENVQRVVRDVSSIDDIISQYDENDMAYGIFIDFNGDIDGTFLIIIPEKNALKIAKEHGGESLIKSLKNFGRESVLKFKNELKINISVGDVHIAYDNIISMRNYLLSEIRDRLDIFLLNVKFKYGIENRGDLIIMPSRKSINYLKKII